MGPSFWVGAGLAGAAQDIVGGGVQHIGQEAEHLHRHPAHAVLIVAVGSLDRKSVV